MFAVVKYLAIDYLYEKMVKERLAFDCLEIHTPSCLYQDKNYYHDGCFDDDKYRRPWIRVSVDSSQIVMNFPVLDIWKECLYVEDFLEKKPISNICLRIHNKEAEVIPSSNPCSQFDIEETCMLTKHNDKELILTSPLQSNYAPAILKEQKEESLSIEDELIFSDDLTQHAKRLPTVHKLLSRLNVFYVQDPLLNSEGDKITEEDIFRECFAFKESKTPQTKREEQCEVFYKETLRDEEVTVLPLLLRVCSTADFRLDTDIPTSLALKTLLEVTPEMLGDENKCFKITRKDFKLEFIPEIIEASSSSSQEVYANQNRSTLEFSNPERYMPFHPRYLEVPLTPPGRPEKLHGDSLLRQLQPESPSLFSKSILITEPIAEYFEALMWQSEKYQHPMNSLLLAEHQTPVPLCHHISVTELKTLLSVQEDLTVLSAFEEEDGFNLRENFTSPYTLETLSTVSDNKERTVCTNAEETFTKTNHFQADKWLEEQSSFATKAEESFSIPDDSGTKKDCWSPPKEEMFPPDSMGCPPEQYSSSVAGDSASTENHVRKTQVDGELGKPMQEDRGNDMCRLTGFREAYVETNSISRNKVPAPSELPRKNGDDFDLLSSFIMLRSKQMVTQNEESKDVEIQEEVLNAQEETPPSENHDSPVVLNATVPLEKQTKENEIGSIVVKAAESQFQAYLILEAAAAPVLKELVSFGIYNWSFATLNFDDSRFFLKQQEKVMSDTFKQDVTGTSNARDITLSKHAALLHLLVTVRDLLLTCNLNTALGYLSKAKDRYEDFLGCTLDKVWRQLKIVQIAVQNWTLNPKITELHHQMSKWVHSNMNNQNKVVIITRMDFDEEIALLINSISTVEGLKTGYLKTERRGTFLESKNVISSLEQYDCVVVHNQHIGPNFPWTCFSSVLEYNYSENSCWIDLCKSMKISYLAFRTAVPEAVEIFPDNSGDVLLKVQIPYIFLTSEGLLNIPEILQLLESEYNVTFIERSACEALQFFGSTEHYVVMTIDEGTAIIVQNVEELNQEKSSDNIVLRLMVLSLQYTTCWMILYSRERLNSEYSLAAKTLHHLALIYAALVSFAQKTEDFDVKVVLTPGLEETALLVRQIADHTLLISKRHPQEWLDKSWLSVLPSESEKCLLTFPCMNPLVAQVMLRKSSSLEWLLSATFDQLQNLLPEVPEKVLKVRCARF
nr:uncharacterized protein C9orf84 homolog [Pogona vitticeps]